jgi:enamine deaminase RidA (YjgF/YER057c/UK114 family)
VGRITIRRYVSPNGGLRLGLQPALRATGEIIDAPTERQTEPVLKLCLETAGSSLENAHKCNVYCASVEKFAAVNAVYARFFPNDPPARIFINVPAWPGHFDIDRLRRGGRPRLTTTRRPRTHEPGGVTRRVPPAPRTGVVVARQRNEAMCQQATLLGRH